MSQRIFSGGVQRWEHQDLVIPLGLSVRRWRHPDYVQAATPQVQPMIAAALEEAFLSGWRADEPTDFATLFSRSQVRTRNTLLYWRIDSATIRLTRAHREDRLVPHG